MTGDGVDVYDLAAAGIGALAARKLAKRGLRSGDKLGKQLANKRKFSKATNLVGRGIRGAANFNANLATAGGAAAGLTTSVATKRDGARKRVTDVVEDNWPAVAALAAGAATRGAMKRYIEKGVNKGPKPYGIKPNRKVVKRAAETGGAAAGGGAAAMTYAGGSAMQRAMPPDDGYNH